MNKNKHNKIIWHAHFPPFLPSNLLVITNKSIRCFHTVYTRFCMFYALCTWHILQQCLSYEIKRLLLNLVIYSFNKKNITDNKMKQSLMLSGSEIAPFTEKQVHVHWSQHITKSEILSILESHLKGGSGITFKKSAKYKTLKRSFHPKNYRTTRLQKLRWILN